jgi:hypothetical protein
MKAEAQEEARRWEEEQEAEVRRKEAMKLSDQERLDILQVLTYFVTVSRWKVAVHYTVQYLIITPCFRYILYNEKVPYFP